MMGCPKGAEKRHAEDSVTYIEVTETSKHKLCSVRVAVQGLLSYAKSLSAVMGGNRNRKQTSVEAAARGGNT